jgi:hypothetical protein
MSLNETVSRIQTRGDFVILLRELLRDLHANPGEWENGTLDVYFEAMAAWTEDADGYYANQGIPTPEQPSWKTLWEILLAAKYYE